ncbi:peptidoglycan hydrolase-like protein with peptidoglycan-binding domain [Ruminiclostridium sufflavum DSM 19573]|uniref:Peptidoglycan hydrolase-like protein with peptidoglycan-binding domain n=1 Tax=Ruminiclostridium sufflavum DSM 19573 TaxID=1121337 RepID=A0A318XMQ7_9FIRM|nr:peptidoglycan-binding protein [Ruminiclostridium sufflavum]PYG86929.1 peptidoglycan hydrolase-like protein with peptidoglycan-binding domain [Ruminiclostridium sufflavum DSM 19573]
MNIKKIKNLAGNFKQKLKKFISEHPIKLKHIVISCSSAAALTAAILMVSTASPLLKDYTADTADISASTEANTDSSSADISTYSEKAEASSLPSNDTSSSEKSITSRGAAPLLDPSKGDIIKLGVKNSIVTAIQNRLMELDYIELDEPTEEYGETIKSAVQIFQRKNELEITGEVDAKTYELLFSDKAKKYTVFIGAEGTDVEQLQTRLYELGYISSVTGYFGTDTEAAVKEFQKRNGLYDDGNVGSQTREILYSSEAVPLSFYLGDENDEIKKYQEKLYDLGYLTTKPDGKYGNDTVIAVKHLQENNGLIADGYIGPATKDLLMSGDVAENALTIGDSGDDVSNIQKYLKKLGYLSSITGYFGSDTHDAVVNFQKRNGLSADGKAGANTISKLLSSNAKAWNGGSGSSGSGNGSSSNGSSSNGSSGSSSSGQNYTDNSGSPSVSALISIAKSKLGARYVYGAKGPSTFDCSGFVYWVLNQAGLRQSYMTSYGWSKNTKYKKITGMSNIRKGDIITFNGHVGIALGDNMMIDASSGSGKVRITNITSSYWTRNFKCAFRIF